MQKKEHRLPRTRPNPLLLSINHTNLPTVPPTPRATRSQNPSLRSSTPSSSSAWTTSSGLHLKHRLNQACLFAVATTWPPPPLATPPPTLAAGGAKTSAPRDPSTMTSRVPVSLRASSRLCLGYVYCRILHGRRAPTANNGCDNYAAFFFFKQNIIPFLKLPQPRCTGSSTRRDDEYLSWQVLVRSSSAVRTVL